MVSSLLQWQTQLFTCIVQTSIGRQVAWTNYLRTLLEPGRIYKFFGLAANRYFIVAEQNIFAGREGPAEGEGEGRPLSVAWFELHATTGQGFMISRMP